MSKRENCLAAAYPNFFAGKVGKLKNYVVKLYVDDKVEPFHLRQTRNAALDKMEAEGLIEEHHGPAPWISNTALAPKDDGGTCVTCDMRNMNKAIQPTNIPIPRVEEIKSELAGCRVFSILDFKSPFTS